MLNQETIETRTDIESAVLTALIQAFSAMKTTIKDKECVDEMIVFLQQKLKEIDVKQ